MAARIGREVRQRRSINHQRQHDHGQQQQHGEGYHLRPLETVARGSALAGKLRPIGSPLVRLFRGGLVL